MINILLGKLFVKTGLICSHRYISVSSDAIDVMIWLYTAPSPALPFRFLKMTYRLAK